MYLRHLLVSASWELSNNFRQVVWSGIAMTRQRERDLIDGGDHTAATECWQLGKSIRQGRRLCVAGPAVCVVSCQRQVLRP